MRKSKKGNYKMKGSSLLQTDDAIDVATTDLGVVNVDGELKQGVKTDKTTTKKGEQREEKQYAYEDQVCHPDFLAKHGYGGPGSKECQEYKDFRKKNPKEDPKDVVTTEESYDFEPIPQPGTPGTPGDEMYNFAPWEKRQKQRTFKITGRGERKEGKRAIRNMEDYWSKKINPDTGEAYGKDPSNWPADAQAQLEGFKQMKEGLNTSLSRLELQPDGTYKQSTGWTLSAGDPIQKHGQYSDVEDVEAFEQFTDDGEVIKGDVKGGTEGDPGSATTEATGPDDYRIIDGETVKSPEGGWVDETTDDSVPKMRAPLKARIQKMKASLAKNYKSGYYK